MAGISRLKMNGMGLCSVRGAAYDGSGKTFALSTGKSGWWIDPPTTQKKQ